MIKINETARWRDTARRREMIVQEAMCLIGERGYYGFGLQELAERCGISKPAVLHHFGSKANLLIELLKERDQQNEALVAKLAGRKSGPIATREALRAIVALNAERPELLRLFVTLRTEAINPEHPAHDYMTRNEQAKLEILAMNFSAFYASPRSVARQVLGVMGGLEEQWLREGKSFDLAAECDAAIATILAAQGPGQE